MPEPAEKQAQAAWMAWRRAAGPWEDWVDASLFVTWMEFADTLTGTGKACPENLMAALHRENQQGRAVFVSLPAGCAASAGRMLAACGAHVVPHLRRVSHPAGYLGAESDAGWMQLPEHAEARGGVFFISERERSAGGEMLPASWFDNRYALADEDLPDTDELKKRGVHQVVLMAPEDDSELTEYLTWINEEAGGIMTRRVILPAGE